MTLDLSTVHMHLFIREIQSLTGSRVAQVCLTAVDDIAVAKAGAFVRSLAFRPEEAGAFRPQQLVLDVGLLLAADRAFCENGMI